MSYKAMEVIKGHARSYNVIQGHTMPYKASNVLLCHTRAYKVIRVIQIHNVMYVNDKIREVKPSHVIF